MRPKSLIQIGITLGLALISMAASAGLRVSYSGISGRSIAQKCWYEAIPAPEPIVTCTNRPFATTIIVWALDRRYSTWARTDARGYFKVLLPTGRYRVWALPNTTIDETGSYHSVPPYPPGPVDIAVQRWKLTPVKIKHRIPSPGFPYFQYESQRKP